MTEYRDDDVEAAIAKPTIDEACLHMQEICCITDGGIAGLCFIDWDDEDWQAASLATRRERIQAWLDAEWAYAG